MKLTWFTLTLVFAGTLSAAEGPKNSVRESKLPASVRITREADAATLVPPTRQFLVKCQVRGEKLTFALPEVTVRDGEQVTLTDQSITSRVIAHKREGEREVPIVRDIVEGTRMQVTVVGIDSEQVVVDVTLTLRGKPTGIPEQMAGKRFAGTEARIVDCLQLGESASCPLGSEKNSIEVTITEAPPLDKPAKEQP